MDFVLYWPGVWALPWSMAHTLSGTPFEKTDFPFTSGYQFQKASWLGVEAHVYFPLWVLGPHFTWTSVSSPCASTVSVYSQELQSCIWKTLFFGLLCHLWLSQSFCLLFYIDPWALKGGVLIKASHLGLSAPKPLIFCTSSSLGPLLIPIYYKKFRWCVLRKVLICKLHTTSFQQQKPNDYHD